MKSLNGKKCLFRNKYSQQQQEKEPVYVLLEIFSLKNAWDLKYGLQYSSSMPPSKTHAAIVSLSKHSQILSKHLFKKRNKNKPIQGKAKD